MLLQNFREHAITQCHNPEELETLFLNSKNQTFTILTAKNKKKSICIAVGKLKGRDHWEEVGVDCRVILKLIMK
jgi:hypothetical protein